MVPSWLRRPYLLQLSRELQSAGKPQCFVFATWWMFGFDRWVRCGVRSQFMMMTSRPF